MTNAEFTRILSASFQKFLTTGSRSNEKLKILHGAIARDLSARLGHEYRVHALGVGNGREGNIHGRYIDKKVDVTICDLGDVPVAGVAVKFVMQNYAQNSNNYFENMLGETANIQSNDIPYFQIFVIPERLPHYNNQKEITSWEEFSPHQCAKYQILSGDNGDTFFHTPRKTLLCVLSIPAVAARNQREYVAAFTRRPPRLEFSQTLFGPFSKMVVYNDYERFVGQVCSYVFYDARQTRNDERAGFVLPVYSLRAACGLFGQDQWPEPMGEVTSSERRFMPHANEKLFVVQAAGRSMEPRIHDGDLCVFRAANAAQLDDIVLAEYNAFDAEHSASYAIKKLGRNGLVSLNREYGAITVSPERRTEYRIGGVFLGALPARESPTAPSWRI